MSIHPTLPGLFEPVQATLPLETAPATDKQIAYARSLAAKTGRALPASLLRSKTGLSAWIDAVRPKASAGRFDAYPSAKQVQFAERIARLKRRQIPAECFKDKVMMSRWIDGNRPR
ncbi:hypothetical protein [uncultured Tateyamaria sp.]|uniref:hypothetical protein n=1 Tax=uncultured Tateyamaria sp. TaxID=455651 RepID=UPI002617DEC1|nr:hypothetical protein [uncultured Tateyamaria sp.]